MSVLVRYVPNILDKENRITKQLPFQAGKKISYYIKQSGFDSKKCRIILSGQKASEKTIVGNGDEIIIAGDIKGPLSPFFVAVGELWTSLNIVGQILVVVSVASAIYSLVTSLTARKPKYNTDSTGMDANSPTYSFDGIVTQKQVGLPIGIVYGRHKVGGNEVVEL